MNSRNELIEKLAYIVHQISYRCYEPFWEPKDLRVFTWDDDAEDFVFDEEMTVDWEHLRETTDEPGFVSKKWYRDIASYTLDHLSSAKNKANETEILAEIMFHIFFFQLEPFYDTEGYTLKSWDALEESAVNQDYNDKQFFREIAKQVLIDIGEMRK